MTTFVLPVESEYDTYAVCSTVLVRRWRRVPLFLLQRVVVNAALLSCGVVCVEEQGPCQACVDGALLAAAAAAHRATATLVQQDSQTLLRQEGRVAASVA